MKAVLAVVIFVFALYLGFCGYFFVKQNNYIFLPTREYSAPPKYLDIADVFIPTADRELLHGWWLTTKNASSTVLFFHGNAGNLSSRTSKLETFRRLKLNALMIDYRGYGKSSGEIKTEKDVYTDAQAAWEFLISDKKILPENIIIWGRSLGATPALYVARGQAIRALILESPFSSLANVAKLHFPLLPIKLLLRSKFNNLEYIQSVSAPKLIIHGRDDRLIPLDQGKTLFDAAAPIKKFIILNGRHNDFISISYNKYLQALKTFLNDNK